MAAKRPALTPWKPAWRPDFDAEASSLVGVPPEALLEALEARDLWPAETRARRYAPALSRPGDDPISPHATLPGAAAEDAPAAAVLGDLKQLGLAMLRGAFGGARAAAIMAARQATSAATSAPAAQAPSLLTSAFVGAAVGLTTHVGLRVARGRYASVPTREQALTIAALGPVASLVEGVALELQARFGRPDVAPLVIWRVGEYTPGMAWRSVGLRVTQSKLVVLTTARSAMARARRLAKTDPTEAALWEVWRAGCAVERVTARYVLIAAPRWRPRRTTSPALPIPTE